MDKNILKLFDKRIIKEKFFRETYFNDLIKVKHKYYIPFEFFENKVDFKSINVSKKSRVKKISRDFLNKTLKTTSLLISNIKPDYFYTSFFGIRKVRSDYNPFFLVNTFFKKGIFKKRIFDYFYTNKYLSRPYFAIYARNLSYMHLYNRYLSHRKFLYYLEFSDNKQYFLLKNISRILNMDYVNNLYFLLKNNILLKFFKNINNYFYTTFNKKDILKFSDIINLLAGKNKVYVDSSELPYSNSLLDSNSAVLINRLSGILKVLNNFLKRKRKWKSNYLFPKFLKLMKKRIYRGFDTTQYLNNKIYTKFNNYKYKFKISMVREVEFKKRKKFNFYYVFSAVFKKLHLFKTLFFNNKTKITRFLMKRYYFLYFIIIRFLNKLFKNIIFVINNKFSTVLRLISFLKIYVLYIFYQKYLNIKTSVKKLKKFIYSRKRRRKVYRVISRLIFTSQNNIYKSYSKKIRFFKKRIKKSYGYHFQKLFPRFKKPFYFTKNSKIKKVSKIYRKKNIITMRKRSLKSSSPLVKRLETLNKKL